MKNCFLLLIAILLMASCSSSERVPDKAQPVPAIEEPDTVNLPDSIDPMLPDSTHG